MACIWAHMLFRECVYLHFCSLIVKVEYRYKNSCSQRVQHPPECMFLICSEQHQNIVRKLQTILYKLFDHNAKSIHYHLIWLSRKVCLYSLYFSPFDVYHSPMGGVKPPTTLHHIWHTGSIQALISMTEM